MAYTEYRPHPALAPYIDAYWQVIGDNMPMAVETILPDGCVDIIMNLGDDELPDPDGFFMKNEQSYLVGTMSRAIETTVSPQSHLIGVRFRPAGFAAFYQYESMHAFTDQTAEFDKSLAPDLRKSHVGPKDALDLFFLRRLQPESQPLIPIIAEIESKNGLIDVVTLARNHCITVRQLQRAFKEHGPVGWADLGLAVPDRAGPLGAVPPGTRPSPQDATRVGAADDPATAPLAARP